MIELPEPNLFKRNMNIELPTSSKINRPMNNNNMLCNKYNFENNSESDLINFCKKYLHKESKLVLDKMNNSKYNNSKIFQKIKRDVVKTYNNRIRLCEEAINVIEEMLNFEDLLDFQIDINAMKNLKKEFKNPCPLKLSKNEVFELALLLMDNINIDSFEHLINKLKEDDYNSNSSKKILESKFNKHKGLKYWQLTMELAIQLDRSSSNTSLKKFFNIDLNSAFVSPYLKSFDSKKNDNKKNNKKNTQNGSKNIKAFFKTKDWELLNSLLRDILDKNIYKNIFESGISKLNWVKSVTLPDNKDYNWLTLNKSKPSGLHGGDNNKKPKQTKQTKQIKNGKIANYNKFDKWVISINKKYAEFYTTNSGKLKNKEYLKDYYVKNLKNPFTDLSMKAYVESVSKKLKDSSGENARKYIQGIINIPNNIYKNISICLVDFLLTDFSEENIELYKNFRKTLLMRLINFYKICIYEICNIKSRIPIIEKNRSKLENNKKSKSKNKSSDRGNGDKKDGDKNKRTNRQNGDKNRKPNRQDGNKRKDQNKKLNVQNRKDKKKDKKRRLNKKKDKKKIKSNMIINTTAI